MKGRHNLWQRIPRAQEIQHGINTRIEIKVGNKKKYRETKNGWIKGGEQIQSETRNENRIILKNTTNK